jgi:integrase
MTTDNLKTTSEPSSITVEAAAKALTHIRSAVKIALAKPIAESTARQYRDACKRMQAAGLVPEQIGARSRRSYQLYRAACVRAIAEHLKQLFDALDKALASGDRVRQLVLITEIKAYGKALDQYPPGGAGPSSWRAPAEGVRRTGKRRSLGRLPVDWREQIFHRCEKYALAVAVLWITGARPAEFVTGIDVERQTDGLLFRIWGAKTSSDRGQPWRAIVADLQSVPAAWLCGRLGPDGTLFVQVGDARQFCDAIRAASRRAWPGRQSVVSPYSFRHQIAADLKASGASREKIAAALGHVHTTSQGAYGLAHQARGRSSTLHVRTARPVAAPTDRMTLPWGKVRSTVTTSMSMADRSGM